MLIVASHVNSEPILICVIYYFVVNNLENTQLAHAMRNNIMVEVNKFAKLLRISLNHTGKDNVDSHRYFNRSHCVEVFIIHQHIRTNN